MERDSWASLEAEFTALAVVGRDLHATHDQTDMRLFAEDRIQRLLATVKRQADPSQPPVPNSEAPYYAARVAVRAAVEARDRKDPTSYWTTSGGPSDEIDRKAVERKYESIAMRAAKLAGLIGADARPDNAFQAWLQLLAEERTPFLGPLRTIQRLPEASALMCHELQTRAVLGSDRSASEEHFNAESGIAWSDVELRVLGDHRLQVFRRGVAGEVVGFAEMGFGDTRRKGDTPVTAWSVLQLFAELGRIQKSGLHGRELTKLEKSIQKIRATLREFLHVQNGDPIHLSDTGYYEPVLKISRARSAER